MADLNDAFKYHRQHDRTATKALELARADVAAGTKRYPQTFMGAAIGAESDGLQWIERPASIGLRFVGWSNDLRSSNSRDSNYGYYTNEFCEETYRGAVYQFPGRDGCAIYIAGYREGTAGRKGNWREWQDDSTGRINYDNGPARLALRSLMYGEPREDSTYDTPDSLRDAAYRADQIAERAAEKERDYQAAWQEGARYADLKQEIASSRVSIKELTREMRLARGDVRLRSIPTVCATLRGTIAGLRRDVQEAREKLATMRRNPPWSKELRAAFNEGASARVFPG